MNAAQIVDQLEKLGHRAACTAQAVGDHRGGVTLDLRLKVQREGFDRMVRQDLLRPIVRQVVSAGYRETHPK